MITSKQKLVSAAILIVIVLFLLALFVANSCGAFLVEQAFISIDKSFHQSGASSPFVIDGEAISWQELDQVLEFEKALWQNRSLEWQLKGLIFNKAYVKKTIIDLLVERKIIAKIAQDRQLPEPSQEEIEAAKTASFGPLYKEFSFGSHSELQARAVTRALKAKIDESLVQRYSGVLVYVRFKGWGAADFDDPASLALSKITELYQRAEQGLDPIVLTGLANSDPEIILLNDKQPQQVFEKFSQADFSIPSPDIWENLKNLKAGQLGQVFELTAIMDPIKNELEGFAYGFFKITGLSGSGQNLEDIIQETKQGMTIEINLD